MKMRLGLDLGGTKIEGIILEPDGREIFRHRVATEQEKGYDAILNRLRQVYQTLVLEIRGRDHTLGIGTPGAISHRTGLLKNSNTVCLNERLSVPVLQQLLEHDFVIENDANCFALAEARLGAGCGKDLVFGVIMGTGCGGGLVINGQVRTGLQKIAGEWGHMVIDPAGPLCYCGQRGCVETLISGGGLEKRYTELTGEKRKLSEIAEDARRGHDQAKDFMKTFLAHYGRAIANLINILDPDIVVLGGGVSNLDELYDQGYAEIRRQVFSDSLETPVVRHALGDSAGVIGAALIGK